ncbi:MAG TPA: hypothetical protein VK466_06590 [Terriglobales bacterium]|nr:hypothetical protein [Terriglobales bacterium]
MPPPRQASSGIRTINLEEGKPLVREALARLEREISLARKQGCALLKLIHGYGSSGAGGDIRIAAQKRLRELYDDGQIRVCIFGENWAPSDVQTWTLLKKNPALKTDSDLGKHNQGITVVVL